MPTVPSPQGAATLPTGEAPRRIGLVVHPSRSVDQPLRLVQEWSEEHGVDVLQVPAAYSQRRVAEAGEPDQADLIVSIGGDGTTLAALRSGAIAQRPVMGIACGSLGALATVAVSDVTRVARALQPRRVAARGVSPPCR